MIYGTDVALRALEIDDLPLLRDWRNRPHYRKYFREYRELNLENQKAWFAGSVVNDHRTLMFGIVERGGGTDGTPRAAAPVGAHASVDAEGPERTAAVDATPKALIGVCGLAYINWVHRNADLSIYIGKDDIYIDTAEGGWAWQTMDALLGYGFNELNLHKVWTEIYAFDEKKHQLFERYGLHRDGVLPDNYFYDGVYQDSHLFSILADEWRRAHG